MRIFSFFTKKFQRVESTTECLTNISNDIAAVHPDECVSIIELRKAGRLDEALVAAHKAIEVMEAAAPTARENWINAFRIAGETDEEVLNTMPVGNRVPWGVIPSPYEQAAMIYRKQKDYANEVSILQRFATMEHCVGNTPDRLLKRLDRATELMHKHAA